MSELFTYGSVGGVGYNLGGNVRGRPAPTWQRTQSSFVRSCQSFVSALRWASTASVWGVAHPRVRSAVETVSWMTFYAEGVISSSPGQAKRRPGYEVNHGPTLQGLYSERATCRNL